MAHISTWTDDVAIMYQDRVSFCESTTCFLLDLLKQEVVWEHKAMPYYFLQRSMIICISTSYLRNITIRPHPIKDWFYFLFIISLINSINYTILILFFSYNIILIDFLINNFFTFLFYLVFVYLFKHYLRGLND